MRSTSCRVAGRWFFEPFDLGLVLVLVLVLFLVVAGGDFRALGRRPRGHARAVRDLAPVRQSAHDQRHEGVGTGRPHPAPAARKPPSRGSSASPPMPPAPSPPTSARTPRTAPAAVPPNWPPPSSRPASTRTSPTPCAEPTSTPPSRPMPDGLSAASRPSHMTEAATGARATTYEPSSASPASAGSGISRNGPLVRLSR